MIRKMYSKLKYEKIIDKNLIQVITKIRSKLTKLLTNLNEKLKEDTTNETYTHECCDRYMCYATLIAMFTLIILCVIKNGACVIDSLHQVFTNATTIKIPGIKVSSHIWHFLRH